MVLLPTRVNHNTDHNNNNNSSSRSNNNNNINRMYTLVGISNTAGLAFVYSCLIWMCNVVPSKCDEDDNMVLGGGGSGLDHGSFHEFKIAVPGNYEECFFQFVPQDATLYVSMEVLQGQDQRIDFFIRDQHMDIIHNDFAVKEGSYNGANLTRGTYAICLDNAYSRFGEKLVYVYITAFEPSKFQDYMKEIEDMENLAGNFTESLSTVQLSVRGMLMYQARSRFHMVHDMYIARGNNYYVSAWSLFQCVVIVICAVIQVYLVRRLFRTTNVTPTSKPRA